MSFPASEAQADTLKNRARVQDSKDDRTHVCMSIPPLDAWIAIKVHLRRELGEKEWELWIRHARLWIVMDHGQFLLVLLPRNGRVTYGQLRHYDRLRKMAARLGFGIGVSMATDWQARALLKEAIEALPWDDPRRPKMVAEYVQTETYLRQEFLEQPCSELWK